MFYTYSYFRNEINSTYVSKTHYSMPRYKKRTNR